MFVGTVAYGAGVGSIPYTMVGEVFTPDYKTLGACMVQSVRYKHLIINRRQAAQTVTMSVHLLAPLA